MLKFLESKKYFVYSVLVIFWIILFIATTLPAPDVPNIGVGDKFEHFGAYFVLAFLLMLTLSIQDKYPLLKANALLFTLLIVPFYGIADELHQLLIPGRSCDFFDWLSDFSGVMIAVIITRFFLRIPVPQKQ